jgi:DNA-binding response OmpR family regulator
VEKGSAFRVLRVLVVHPSHGLRSLLAAILYEYGCTPVPAETVEDARAVIAADPPDFAIVDEVLVSDLASPSLPTIALARLGARPLVIEAGACCAVEKPIREDELMRAVGWVVQVYCRRGL